MLVALREKPIASSLVRDESIVAVTEPIPVTDALMFDTVGVVPAGFRQGIITIIVFDPIPAPTARTEWEPRYRA